MQRTLTAAALSVGLIVGMANAARADDKHKDNDRGIRVEVSHAGLGALAGWIAGAGEPNQKGDRSQYGLYLQKATQSNNFAFAGADITRGPAHASRLETLAFSISGVPGASPFDASIFGEPAGSHHGYCNNGGPRFNVSSDAVVPNTAPPVGATCFLGCAHGDKTQNPDTGWWEIKFSSPFTQYPGCEFGVVGTISSIGIILDEGNDLNLGVLGTSPGNVVVDNITVNHKVVGKPRGDDDD